ncbi:MAG: UDP-N-acetylmuramoyl-tripeptide--D-alanyl-D-alanine ligase, partial [Planctomycetota bacterium]
MEQVSIRQVAAWAGGHYDGPDLPVEGVSIDSRRVGRGELFVALGGDQVDGHDFLGEAFASGAVAALAHRADAVHAHRMMGHPVVRVADTRRALADFAAAYRRSLGLTVIGITGSNGKTTTKEMLRLLLGPKAAASPQSFNNELGVPLTLLGADRSHEYCIVELGTNTPGEIASLAAIAQPQVGVVLNVGESHLRGLGSIQGVAREKFSLVEALGADGCAVLNWDDLHTREMIGRAASY